MSIKVNKKAPNFLLFDQNNNKAIVNNIKKQTTEVFETKNNVQDLISALYYLRKNFSEEETQIGEEFKINMFYDSKNREYRHVIRRSFPVSSF